mmetsp:Transcript_43218/g.116558  ORF Transcript_43218/g.116558 Transcript_43218/m.116558 type:complete len:555 (-) Transcript_43218:85-1749(-)
MGCGASADTEQQQELPEQAESRSNLIPVPPSEQPDSRWDTEGFNTWCRDAQIGWVRVGYLRHLAATGGILPCRQDVPAEWLHIGVPPGQARLYGVSARWLSREHPDPQGVTVKYVVGQLDKNPEDAPHDDDLVFLDYAAIFQNTPERARTDEQQMLFAKAVKGMGSIVFSYYRVQSIIAVAPGVHGPNGMDYNGMSYFGNSWCYFEFCQISWSRRIINSSDPVVASGLTPEFLLNFEIKIKETEVKHSADKEFLLKKYCQICEHRPRARKDALGFRTVCKQANYRWVKVSFIHRLAMRGGPAPRRRDLPIGTYVDGEVPPGVQPWVVSYGWAAVTHFSPSGAKIRELSEVLRELGAQPDGLVFLDFMSMWQSDHIVPQIYAEKNVDAALVGLPSEDRMVRLPPMTKEMKQEKALALYESTRLYAFEGCKVLILPELEGPECFRDGGDITEEMNTFCSPARKEKNTRWGFAKSIPYHNGGWTCAEYAVARYNGTIANPHHESVKRVDCARAWPKNVTDFAVMMDENSANPVAFTKKGDRDAVRFNFYKYCYHFLD